MTTSRLEADKLRLPGVPSDDRARIVERITPWLRGVRRNHCFENAQSFVLAARARDVKYIEGVYGAPQLLLSPGYKPLPHAWAVVETYRIDLTLELMLSDAPCEIPEYETEKEYSHEQLAAVLLEKGIDRGYKDITSFLLDQSDRRGEETSLPEDVKWKDIQPWPCEHARREGTICSVAFKPAASRLIERIRMRSATVKDGSTQS